MSSHLGGLPEDKRLRVEAIVSRAMAELKEEGGNPFLLMHFAEVPDELAIRCDDPELDVGALLLVGYDMVLGATGPERITSADDLRRAYPGATARQIRATARLKWTLEMTSRTMCPHGSDQAKRDRRSYRQDAAAQGARGAAAGGRRHHQAGQARRAPFARRELYQRLAWGVSGAGVGGGGRSGREPRAGVCVDGGRGQRGACQAAEACVILLDTHIFLGALDGSLRPREERLLRADASWAIADIVLWEMAMLHAKRRIVLDVSSASVRAALAPVVVFPITAEIAARACRLDFASDPADHLISATSLVHGVPLMTRDRKIRTSKLVQFA